jgi:hypothetical protein
MTMNSRWELVLALAGSAAVGAVLALSRRSERRHVEKRQHKHDLQAWEEEGGSLATPATARHRS